MAASVIGALRVNLGLNSAQFSKGLKNANSQARSFASRIGGAFKVAAAGLALATTGMAVAVKGVINEADKMSKAAQSVGIATEELSKLAWAADLSGVSFEKLTGSIAKLSKAMGDSLRSKTSEQALAFKALGISVTDANGQMRSSRAVLDDVADSFQGMADGTEKTALAMAIFGRSGKEIIPLLNQGAAGLKEMGNEAERLGIVIDTKTGRRAEMFNDTLNRISAVFRGVVTQIASRVLPALLDVAEHLFDVSGEGTRMKSIISASVVVFKGLATAVLGTVDAFRAFVTIITGAARALEALRTGDYSGALDSLKTAWAETKSIVASSVEAIKDIWNDADFNEEEIVALPKRLSAGLADVYKTATKTESPWKNLANHTDKLNENMQAGRGILSGFLSDMRSGLQQGENAWQALGNAATNVLNKIIDRLQNNLVDMIFPMRGGFGGPSLSPLNTAQINAGIGGLRANGGPVKSGVPYIVGEKRPELFVPSQNGSIVPKVPNMGGNTFVNIENNTGAQVSESRRQSGGNELVDIVIGIANSGIAGGKMDKSMSRFGASPQARPR